MGNKSLSYSPCCQLCHTVLRPLQVPFVPYLRYWKRTSDEATSLLASLNSITCHPMEPLARPPSIKLRDYAMHTLLIEFSEIIAAALAKRWLELRSSNDQDTRPFDTGQANAMKPIDTNTQHECPDIDGDLRQRSRSVRYLAPLRSVGRCARFSRQPSAGRMLRESIGSSTRWRSAHMALSPSSGLWIFHVR